MTDEYFLLGTMFLLRKIKTTKDHSHYILDNLDDIRNYDTPKQIEIVYDYQTLEFRVNVADMVYKPQAIHYLDHLVRNIAIIRPLSEEELKDIPRVRLYITMLNYPGEDKLQWIHFTPFVNIGEMISFPEHGIYDVQNKGIRYQYVPSTMR